MVKEIKKRARADSVLEARVDGLQDLKKLKSSQSNKWKKMKALIAKDTTKLCLIQVPKNVSHPLNSEVDNLKLCLFLVQARW